MAFPVVGGRLLRGLGAGDEGYHKAVDVAGHITWQVRAIDDGIVVQG